jgi:hypothetical protein
MTIQTREGGSPPSLVCLFSSPSSFSPPPISRFPPEPRGDRIRFVILAADPRANRRVIMGDTRELIFGVTGMT